jgi:hypothetical protein
VKCCCVKNRDSLLSVVELRIVVEHSIEQFSHRAIVLLDGLNHRVTVCFFSTLLFIDTWKLEDLVVLELLQFGLAIEHLREECAEIRQYRRLSNTLAEVNNHESAGIAEREKPLMGNYHRIH